MNEHRLLSLPWLCRKLDAFLLFWNVCLHLLLLLQHLLFESLQLEQMRSIWQQMEMEMEMDLNHLIFLGPLLKVHSRRKIIKDVHDFMAGLPISENASMTQQNGASPGAHSETIFSDSTMNPNHLVSNNVFNGILDDSQAARMNVNPMFSLGPMAYNISSGLMFSPSFPSQPVNYYVMGNFLTQQQFLSTTSNFQQVGNLQSQNTGVSHAAGTKGVYSSPLPDIFNPNIPTRTPSSVMNSSKKEETKAFDFISGFLPLLNVFSLL